VLNVLKSKATGPRRVIGLELGVLTSRAVHLEHSGEHLKVLKFSVRESPLKQPDLTPEALAEHFRKLTQDLQAQTKDLVVSLGMEESILQRIQMPRAPADELRQILKISGTKYFPQDISNLVFDASVVPRVGGSDAPRLRGQADVLVAAARRDRIELIKKAAKLAGLRLVEVSLTMVGLADALRVYNLPLLKEKPVVVGKIGFTYASVTFLVDGLPVLTRILDIDGEKLSKGLAEAYNVPRHIPVEEKMQYIRCRLKQVFEPLAADFQTAMDFFESEYEQKVTTGFMFGELVVSKLALETLQELDVPCSELETEKLCRIEASPEETTWFSQELPQLVSAIGSAGGFLTANRVPLNLIAEELEERARRRRDPVRYVAIAACFLVCLFVAWAGQLRVRMWRLDAELQRDKADREQWEKMRWEITLAKSRLAEANNTLHALDQHATNRFLFASALNALQHAIIDDIHLTRLVMEGSALSVPARKNITEKGVFLARKPGSSTETVTLTLQAKNFAGPEQREKFIEKLASVPYFKEHLRADEPVVLRNYMARQVDPLDPSKTFNLFTLECMYPERVVGYD
jgi:Tfp pilus assembly PilM family ATPase